MWFKRPWTWLLRVVGFDYYLCSACGSVVDYSLDDGVLEDTAAGRHYTCGACLGRDGLTCYAGDWTIADLLDYMFVTLAHLMSPIDLVALQGMLRRQPDKVFELMRTLVDKLVDERIAKGRS